MKHVRPKCIRPIVKGDTGGKKKNGLYDLDLSKRLVQSVTRCLKRFNFLWKTINNITLLVKCVGSDSSRFLVICMHGRNLGSKNGLVKLSLLDAIHINTSALKLRRYMPSN